jgi:hypothetical protein
MFLKHTQYLNFVVNEVKENVRGPQWESKIIGNLIIPVWRNIGFQVLQRRTTVKIKITLIFSTNYFFSKYYYFGRVDLFVIKSFQRIVFHKLLPYTFLFSNTCINFKNPLLIFTNSPFSNVPIIAKITCEPNARSLDC